MRISFASLSLAAILAMHGSMASDAPQPRIAISITVLQTVVKTDSEIRIAMSLKNTSNHDIGFLKGSQGHAEIYCDIDVRDDQGNVVPVVESHRGVQTKNGMIVAIRASSGPGVSLKPGETLQDEFVVSELFDLHRPGKYTFQAKHFDAASSTVVKSNIVTLTVTE